MHFRNRSIVCFIFMVILLLPATVTMAGDEQLYLETVGGFGGSYIYTTYAFIQVTADAFSKDLYQPGQVKVMMDETVGMLNKLTKRLEKVKGTNLEPPDRQFIESMIEILGLLKSEAEYLAAFSTSKDPHDIDRYEQTRKNVWTKIKQLLGMK